MPSLGTDPTQPGCKGITPIWHTVILTGIFLALDFREMAGGRSASPPRALPFYLGAIAFEWLLFAYVWWGIRLKRYPLAALIGRGPAIKYGRDAAVGVAIWLLWYGVESLIALGLAAAGLTNAGAQGSSFHMEAARSSSGSPWP